MKKLPWVQVTDKSHPMYGRGGTVVSQTQSQRGLYYEYVIEIEGKPFLLRDNQIRVVSNHEQNGGTLNRGDWFRPAQQFVKVEPWTNYNW